MTSSVELRCPEQKCPRHCRKIQTNSSGTIWASSESLCIKNHTYYYSLPPLPYTVCNVLPYSINLLALNTYTLPYTDCSRCLATKKHKIKLISIELYTERFISQCFTNTKAQIKVEKRKESIWGNILYNKTKPHAAQLLPTLPVGSLYHKVSTKACNEQWHGEVRLHGHANLSYPTIQLETIINDMF